MTRACELHSLRRHEVMFKNSTGDSRNLFEFDTPNNTLRSSWEGRVTEEALLVSYSAGQRYAASHPPYRSILDFSSVTSFDVPTEALRTLGKRPPPSAAQMMFVIVAPGDLVYGLSRMFAVLGEETRPNLRVVRTMQEAYDLLEIDSPQFSPINID
jgi:hypothetical protein